MVTANWITPPELPNLILINKDNTLANHLGGDIPTNGKILFIRYKREKNRYSKEYQKIIYNHMIKVIGFSEDSLELIFDQIDEVFDTYEKTPTAINGNTYQLARVFDEEHTSNIGGTKFTRESIIQLGELKQGVVYGS